MKQQQEGTGTVLRIERTSIHDGPGLRTVLFLKGCPLRCSWCSTPESQHTAPEKGYAPDRCTGCGICVYACPEGALSVSDDTGKVLTDASKCKTCFHCVTKCPQRAMKQYGRQMTVGETVQEISKDEIFFFHSGGGVTISGGEPLYQPEFVAHVLQACRERGIHTAMETSLYAPFESIEKILPWLGTLYVDLKHMDSDLHKLWVGPDNVLTLENITKVDQSNYPVQIIVRIPMIPGVNDTDTNLSATAHFCQTVRKLKEIELLPYHRLGMDTYKHLGLDYSLKELCTPSPEYIMERATYLSNQNPHVTVRVGGGFA